MFKELKQKDWVCQIDQGLEFRRLYGKEQQWSFIEAMASNASSASANHAPNIVYAMGDDLISSLHVPNPVLLLKPQTMAEIGTAPILESIDNHLIKELKIKRELEIGTYAAYQWGTSFIKIGYDSEFGWDPALDYNGTKAPYGMSLSQLDAKQRFIEFNNIEPGMPWVAHVPPHDIVVPWGVRDLDHASFVCHRVVRHIDEIKSDAKYENTKMLQPNMSKADWVKSYQSVIKPYRLGMNQVMSSLAAEGETEFVELWEIHDKRTGKIFVIATGYDKFLRNDRNALQINGLPFVELGFTPKTRNIWRTSDADYLLQAQAELGDISIQGSKQRRANVLKFLYDKNTISREELNKLLSSDVGIAAGIDMKGKDLRNVIVPFQAGNNQNLYQESQFVRENARETSGFTKTQAGEYAGARTSAFEVQQVQQARDTRMTRRQTVVADAYIEILRKVNDIIFKYWRTPRVIQYSDPDGLQQWINYTGSQLKGRFSYDMSFNSAPTETDSSRQQRAMMFYQVAASDPYVDPIMVRRWLAQSFRDVGIGQIFKPGVISGIPIPGGGVGQPNQPGSGTPGAIQNPVPSASRVQQASSSN